jgi:hypothetical protein
MDLPFENVGLWSRTLGMTDPQNREYLERLTTAFKIFRKRTEKLLNRISSAFPNLTVHDITHIDALWETADLVIGKNYPINPMEAYVLGGAMLLHDSALCFEAYEEGRSGIRKTVQWRDAFAAEKDRNGEKSEQLSDEQLNSAADFTAVRLLHGKQAEQFAERSWTDGLHPVPKTPS